MSIANNAPRALGALASCTFKFSSACNWAWSPFGLLGLTTNGINSRQLAILLNLKKKYCENEFLCPRTELFVY